MVEEANLEVTVVVVDEVTWNATNKDAGVDSDDAVGTVLAHAGCGEKFF